MPFDGKQNAEATPTSPGSDNWNTVPFDHIMTVTSNAQVPGRFVFCAGDALKLATVADANVYPAPGFYVFCQKGDDDGPIAPVFGELKRWKRHGCELVGWPRKPVFVRFADYPMVWRVVGSHPGKVGRANSFYPRAPVPMPYRPDAIFSPEVFIAAIADAVVPLIKKGPDGGLREGHEPDDVRNVLRPLCGAYTVADAAALHSLLRGAGEAYFGSGTSRCNAIWQARESLLKFICNGLATSPACATARAEFAKTGDGDGDELGRDLNYPLHFRISCDIGSLRDGDFIGETFGGTLFSSRSPAA